MRRYGIAVLFCTFLHCASAQTASPTAPISDAQAVSLAQQSNAALTGGATISDVTLSANVISTVSATSDTGTGTLRAKGNAESRVDLNLTAGTTSDVRNATNGLPSGAWAKNSSNATGYAQHNCWTDASWFFPALSSLAQTGNKSFVFRYIGQEVHRGVSTQHIQIFQNLTSFAVAQQLSASDFYLDPVSFLPLAMSFNSHPDNDINSNIPTEILFANYQGINNVKVPFHIQKVFNGTLNLDLTVTNVVFNTPLLDSSFTLP